MSHLDQVEPEVQATEVPSQEAPEPVQSIALPTPEPAHSGWLKVGVIAAASALVGGLAAAWYYRKTLASLQQAGSTPEPEPSSEDDL